MIQSKLHSPYSVHINPIFLLFFEYLFATYKNQQRQQASSLAAVVDCDRKYVPNNVYGSYLRVMVEPRGVEPLESLGIMRVCGVSCCISCCIILRVG